MDKDSLVISVECYAGYRGEELPRRFNLGNTSVEITEILDRWLAPDHRYFKVKAKDGSTYILRHDTNTDLWELTLFDSGKLEQTKLSAT